MDIYRWLCVLGCALSGLAISAEDVWLGEAPFCRATPSECKSIGLTYVTRHAYGDGETCLTGHKVLCRGIALGRDLAAALGQARACPRQGRGTASALTCSCAAELTTGGTVWGSGPYTDDSSICRAALHSGVIGSNGGVLRVVRSPGLSGYTGSRRNGVQTKNYGRWDGSFAITTP